MIERAIEKCWQLKIREKKTFYTCVCWFYCISLNMNYGVISANKDSDKPSLFMLTQKASL